LPRPATTHLDGAALAQALVSGIHRVIGEQDFLNKINVFPVADGDTGTNLSLSLASALAVLSDADEERLGPLLERIADALLDGSRGNSGAIVAQFFQGVADSAADIRSFSTRSFSIAVARGNEYAHDAISAPREGTILTVIAAVSESISSHVDNVRHSQFPALMKTALEVADAALAQTTNQLDELRKAGVVDAGAKGFVELLRGMHDFIVHGEVAEQPDLSILSHEDSVPAMAGFGEDSEFRYCTECIVSGISIDRRKLREKLSTLGDSLVLAGTKRKAKVHIHVNDPEDVFLIASEYGRVSAQKTDDMHRQAHSSRNASSRFAVITDSAADIADEDLERLDIHIVPCRLQFGDRSYLDKVSISPAEFFEELATNPAHPTTSQPAPGDFRRQYQFLASHFPDVLSINLTGSASGTLEAARSAAGRIHAQGRVHVINTRNVSVGQGQLVVFAAECARAGISVETTIDAIENLIPATQTHGMLGDVRYAVRGGRVPSWVETATSLFNITPFIRANAEGRVVPSGFAFGKRGQVRKFAERVVRNAQSLGPISVAIAHAACSEEGARLERLLRLELPQIERLTRVELGAALGVHAGPGALVVSIQPVTTLPV
jgi:DegV family protein with EDD domain